MAAAVGRIHLVGSLEESDTYGARPAAADAAAAVIFRRFSNISINWPLGLNPTDDATKRDCRSSSERGIFHFRIDDAITRRLSITGGKEMSRRMDE